MSKHTYVVYCTITRDPFPGTIYGGNTMTRSNRRERYRAELRTEILAAARYLIRENGYSGLTLRKLVQRLECSPMAFYSYFADNQALLTALAAEGLEKLARRLNAEKHRNPLTFLRKLLLEYVAYAEENPFEYRILFLSVEAAAEVKKTRQDLEEDTPAFHILFDCVSKCISAGLVAGGPFSVSTVLWAGAYGASTILITQGNFPFSSRKRYIDEVIATLLSGIQKRSVRRI